MPYKNPERKRQWEREHREQRNARRREQGLDARSGQPTVSNTTSDMTAAQGTLRNSRTYLNSRQQPNDRGKVVIGWAVGVFLVLLGVFASVSSPTVVDGDASPE
jgi:hypothetical protein